MVSINNQQMASSLTVLNLERFEKHFIQSNESESIFNFKTEHESFQEIGSFLYGTFVGRGCMGSNLHTLGLNVETHLQVEMFNHRREQFGPILLQWCISIRWHDYLTELYTRALE